jgi:hypothetical protein
VTNKATYLKRLTAPKEIDVMPWMALAAFEYIGQAALGHSLNDLDIDARDVYTQADRNLG